MNSVIIIGVRCTPLLHRLWKVAATHPNEASQPQWGSDPQVKEHWIELHVHTLGDGAEHQHFHTVTVHLGFFAQVSYNSLSDFHTVQLPEQNQDVTWWLSVRNKVSSKVSSSSSNPPVTDINGKKAEFHLKTCQALGKHLILVESGAETNYVTITINFTWILVSSHL